VGRTTAWMDRFKTEIDNFRAAMDRALAAIRNRRSCWPQSLDMLLISPLGIENGMAG